MGVCVLDADLRYCAVNQRLAQMNGLTVQSHLGRTVAEIVPSLAAEARQVFDAVVRSGQAMLDHEFSGETAAAPGVQGHWSQSWYPLPGPPLRVAVLVEDITARRQHDEAVRVRQRHDAFVLRLDDALRPLADPTEVQEVAARLLGQTLGASRAGYAEDAGDGEHVVVTRHHCDGVPGIEGRYRYDDYGPELRRAFRAGVAVVRPDVAADPSLTAQEKAAHAALALGSTVNVPLVKGGAIVAVFFVHQRTPRDWRDDELTLIEETAERVWAAVQRARAEAAQRTAHDSFRQLVEHTPFGIYTVDADFRMSQVSAGARRAFANVQPLIGRDLAEVLRTIWPEPTASDFIARFRHTLATGEPYHSPATVQRRRDIAEEQAYDWQIKRIVLPDGRPGVVCHFYDLSERQRYEAELRISEERLRDADRRKDQFLAMLAHELRNPLAPIANAVAVLQAQASAAPEAARFLSMIDRQLGHLTRLVDDLLDVSRVTQGKVRLALAPMDLCEALQAGVELARAAIDARGHRLRLALPPSGQVWVRADATRLAQVVSNLLNNAAKYTEPGGRIELALSEEEDGRARIDVSDDGSGIRPALLPHIFDVFTQDERALDRAEGGLGLGLALVRSLVELHGGSVAARSAGPGCGSTFTIRLPRVPAPPVAAPAGRDPGAHGARRVLIVDDNADAADSLGTVLEIEGHEVLVLHDPAAALARAPAFAPQVCVLDIGLPAMDGHELARRLRTLLAPAGCRCIALSGYAPPDDPVRRADFEHFLVKPTDPAALLALISGR